jgi:transcriptional regulator with XRE-family HTH domain
VLRHVPEMKKSIHSASYRVLLDLLVSAREARGVTQVELAKRLQMTQSAISKVERGERRLDVVELHAWCQALELPFVTMARQLDAKLRR